MKKMFKSDLEVPFDKNGNMLNHPSRVEEWRENCQFVATLRYIGSIRGCSSMRFLFSDENDVTYPMFVTDFDQMIIGNSIDFNAINGVFYFIKRGQNYGIKMEQGQ